MSFILIKRRLVFFKTIRFENAHSLHRHNKRSTKRKIPTLLIVGTHRQRIFISNFSKKDSQNNFQETHTAK
jgi:hypothetical protein